VYSYIVFVGSLHFCEDIDEKLNTRIQKLLVARASHINCRLIAASWLGIIRDTDQG